MLFNPQRIIYYIVCFIILIGGLIYYYHVHVEGMNQSVDELLGKPATPSMQNPQNMNNQTCEAMLKVNVDKASEAIRAAIKRGLKPDEAIHQSITFLNQAGTPADSSDDPKSIFDNTKSAFATAPAPGVVTLSYDSTNITFLVTAYDQNLTPRVIDTITLQ